MPEGKFIHIATDFFEIDFDFDCISEKTDN